MWSQLYRVYFTIMSSKKLVNSYTLSASGYHDFFMFYMLWGYTAGDWLYYTYLRVLLKLTWFRSIRVTIQWKAVLRWIIWDYVFSNNKSCNKVYFGPSIQSVSSDYLRTLIFIKKLKSDRFFFATCCFLSSS